MRLVGSEPGKQNLRLIFSFINHFFYNITNLMSDPISHGLWLIFISFPAFHYVIKVKNDRVSKPYKRVGRTISNLAVQYE